MAIVYPVSRSLGTRGLYADAGRHAFASLIINTMIWQALKTVTEGFVSFVDLHEARLECSLHRACQCKLLVFF